MDLKEKAAVVTGASKGIGRAIAVALARAGANVSVSARSKDLLESTADEIRAQGVEVHSFAGDMRNEANIREFISGTVQKFGRLDVLVNNAGIGHFHRIIDMPLESWDEMFDLNVRGLFIATRESLPHLRNAGESVIVNIASIAAKNAFVSGGGYAPSKHAVLAFSRCLMLEERDNGVRVLAICPGSVRTNFFDPQHEEMAPRFEKMLRPEDVAKAILEMIRMPQRAMISEVDIRPTNP
ncbi:MAG: SDR family NAD(P)-dependent oxidoreductase [Candidatus Latescibacteria bacterium]|nr:SDR family NAD(P)-dependent oxidoreductase [Candidatus Latescibacterota bacterium]NIM21697.1 SDR family NAD(P)-dependent oxidoreductase [Candidatus Latescibacterota bacterium]NIM65724.1 SDR family NAD(P)-dependent oxidoreductase [Candidatus Latescibacterota bacterium]NIO02109.1 SDR family NAD(P)-dependent oxidoreductase [Candidatus Latescibacterota bacterium]NIO28926.1 SDR family NAD(P)-dependent oxidoreductase [Candidatus Latescibacterota bacterium]